VKAKQRSGGQEWQDPDDAPVLTGAFFDAGAMRQGEMPRRRARPQVATPKKMISLRLDDDVLVRLRALGPGWQTRVNGASRVLLDAGSV
jgi:uncharacterized protein (DUF4415 family)